jgi:YVTN family beta-propeller protein
MLALGLALFLAPPQRVSDSLLPTGARVRPAGQVTVMPGRPVDLVASRDGRRLFVKDHQGLRVLDAETGRELGTAASPGGCSFTGLVASRDGRRVFLTSATTKLHEYDVSQDAPKLLRSIELPGPGGKGNSFPCGLQLSAEGAKAFVCLSRNNTLGIVDLTTGKLTREIPVGVAPYGVAVLGNAALVTNLGGRRATGKRPTAPSSGTETEVDGRGVALQGSVSAIDLGKGRVRWETTVRRQPSAIVALGSARVAVTETNDDSVALLDAATGRLVSRLVVKPDARLPFGSMPNALAAGPTPSTLWVALAGNNAVAVVDVADARRPRIRGFVPSGWYPTALTLDRGRLAIASLKGLGSRRSPRPAAEGRNSYDYASTVQRLAPPSPEELKAMTRQVMEDVNAPLLLRAHERVVRSKAAPVPVPKRLGDPSVFEHVVYVIKENRTYDQIFGDMKIGDGDPRLCTYGEEVTPNHHAIAREFGLLDNYYCNGVLSADGHSWATEGNVTPYLERAFGGFNRSYTFGDDPITYSASGFLWDRVLDAGLAFRNFGEMDYATVPEGMKLRDLLKARGGPYPAFKHSIGVERLRRYSDPEYPGWNTEIPDVLRLDRFLAELGRWERDGGFPNLVIVYLPQDHTGSSVTNRANVADNDLAVGRLVEALSRSRYWAKTVAFINEDDPQNGFDHVDGHRSVCLVASPYSRGRGVVSKFYNQTSVLHTMLRILGLPPLNQRDAASPLMTACFGPKPDLRPYTARENRIPLDETTVPKQTAAFTAYAAKIKARLAKIPRGKKTRADEDALNRLIWHEAKGLNAPYPAHLAGPHGKGLKRRGLVHGEVEGERDEE